MMAVLGGFIGAWLLTYFESEWLRKVLPVLLGFVFWYTLVSRHFGRDHVPTYHPRYEAALAGVIAFFLGLYDGFFGPGTGSFFVFFFVRFLGYDFLHASASAKALNAATNAAAICVFAFKWGDLVATGSSDGHCEHRRGWFGNSCCFPTWEWLCPKHFFGGYRRPHPENSN